MNSSEDHSTQAGFFTSRKVEEPKLAKNKKNSNLIDVQKTKEEQKIGSNEVHDREVEQEYFSFIGVIDNSNFKIFQPKDEK